MEARVGAAKAARHGVVRRRGPTMAKGLMEARRAMTKVAERSIPVEKTASSTQEDMPARRVRK